MKGVFRLTTLTPALAILCAGYVAAQSSDCFYLYQPPGGDTSVVAVDRTIRINNTNFTFTYDFIFTAGKKTVTIVSSENPFPYTVSYDDAPDMIDGMCPNGITGVHSPSFNPSIAAAAGGLPAAGIANELLALGDFNNDGVADSAQITPSGIQVKLLGTGGAVLATANYAVSGIGSSLLAADFNGDGVIDLAATQDDTAGNVVVLLGKGDGTFQPAVKYAAGEFASYAVAADFNGDGIMDLAVSNIGAKSGSVYVLLGKGNGTFAAGVPYAVGNYPGTVAAGDFNNDGKLDIAVVDSQSGTLNYVNKVWVLPGKGDGTFGAAISTPSGTGSAYLSFADINQDGKLDLAIADQSASAMAILLGNGDGTFKAPVEYVAGGQPTVAAPIPLQDGTTALVATDSTTSGLNVSFTDTKGTIPNPILQSLGSGPVWIAAGDLNGDKQPDLVVSDPEAGKVYVELGTGGGSFGPPVTYTLGTKPAAVALADVNGDGKPDVLLADANGLDVMTGKGDGTLNAVQTFASGGALSSIAIADFNGDGKPDAAATNAAGGVALFLGNGDGTFQGVRTVAISGTPLSLVAGDFNGDGKQDLIAVSASGPTQPGSLAVLLGNGDGTFQAPLNVALPGPVVQQQIGSTVTAALAAGDFTGDGKLDVAVAISVLFANKIAVLTGNGDGSFQTPVLTSISTAPPMMAATDLNQDHKLDLVLADCCGLTEASYLIGQGDGTFQTEFQFPSGPNPRALAVADFDGNGIPDIAVIGQVQQPDHGTLAVMLNPFRSPQPATLTATAVSAASAQQTTLAPSSLATIYGADLASSTPGGTSLPLPTTVAGTSVSIHDAAGNTNPAPLIYVSPTQVNFLVPDNVAAGLAQITVTSGDGTSSGATVQMAAVAPALFQLNSSGLAAAQVVLVSGNTQTNEDVYQVAGGAVVASPVSLGSGSDQAFLLLYGTGLRAAGTQGVSVTIGGVAAMVQYADTQGGFAGLDQVNVSIPQSLAGAGPVTIEVTANGVPANPVNITIQ